MDGSEEFVSFEVIAWGRESGIDCGCLVSDLRINKNRVFTMKLTVVLINCECFSRILACI